MSEFRAIPAGEPIKVVQVGAGAMGRQWLKAVQANPEVELVGLVDIDLDAAKKALVQAGLANVSVGTDVAAVAQDTLAHAIVNVTIPAAHLDVSAAAMSVGCHVLCEKPSAPTVAEAMRLASTASVASKLVMISQSRRYLPELARLRDLTQEMAPVGVLTTEFFKAPHFGGFREEMDHVLLVDMAIHSFDAARYLLGAEPISVFCEEYNPEFSWYKGAANTVAIFEFENGIRYVYTGSWCAEGLETSWNGQWRVSAARGTAAWDGERSMEVENAVENSRRTVHDFDDSPREIEGALAEFVTALRSGEAPVCEVHANVNSLAMVEAAVRSAESGRRVSIATVLADARESALAEERDDEVRRELTEGGVARLCDSAAARDSSRV